MSKYVVTGATGHLGNVLIRELLAKGHTVKALVLQGSDVSPLDGLDVDIAYCDVTDIDTLSSLIEKDDVVFHLAGIIDINDMPYDTIYKVNCIGTRNVTDVCIANKAKRLIYTSSVHVIQADNDDLISEPDSYDASTLVGSYAKTKALATQYVIGKAEQGELDAVVVYPAGIIGPHDYFISELGQVVLDYMKGKLTAYVKGGYNFVDVRDVAAGLIAAAEKGESGQGYILSGRYATLKELFKLLNVKLGRTKLPYKIALWFVRAMVPLANLYYKIRGKKPVFSAYSLYALNSNANFSCAKAQQQLGYTARGLDETLNDTVDWFRLAGHDEHNGKEKSKAKKEKAKQKAQQQNP